MQHANTPVFLRKLEGHDCTHAFLALDSNLSAVLAHDPLDNHHAKPMAARLGRVVRLKDFYQVLLFDARTRIAKQQVDALVIRPSFNPQDASRLHGLHRVFDDIKESLLELITIGHDYGQIGRKLRSKKQLDAFLKGDWNRGQVIKGPNLRGLK